jgi:hypothetical protein
VSAGRSLLLELAHRLMEPFPSGTT